MQSIVKRTTLIVRDADGALLRMTALGFRDPDGCFFEIIQRHSQ